MSPAILAALRAGFVPGEAVPDMAEVGLPVAMDWNIDGEAPSVATGTIVERISDDRVLWYSTNPRIWTDNRSLAFLRFPLSERVVRQRVATVMGVGARCPECGGAPPLLGVPGHQRRPVACPSCDEGYLRPPAPARHLLPASELGDLPDALAAFSGELLACHVARVLVGLGGVVDVLEPWRREFRYAWGRKHATESGHMPSFTVHDTEGWRAQPASGWSKGPETGPEGMAAADRAALLAGFALHNADGMVLPWPQLNEAPNV